MSLNPQITKDANAVYWLEWDPDLNSDGYTFTTPGGTSRTFNNSVAKVKLGKGWPEPFTATVAPLDVQVGAGETASYPVVVEPPPLPPPPGSWQEGAGIATGAKILSRTVAERNRELDLIVEVGARISRFDYGGPVHDDEIQAALDRHLDHICTVYGTVKQSANPSPALSGQVAAKFKGRVRKYEIANEVDLQGWTPNAYADFYLACAKLIRTADSAAKIYTSGLWKGDNRSPVVPPEEFCKAIIARVPKQYVDGFGIHLYDPTSWIAPQNQWAHLDTCRGLLDAAGWKDIPIVSTEGGGGRDVGDATQVSRVTDYLAQLKSGRIAIACVFSMLTDYATGFQLVQDTGAKRPAFFSYQKAVA